MNPRTRLILNVITTVIIVLIIGFIGGADFAAQKMRADRSWAETGVNRDTPGWLWNEAQEAAAHNH